MLFKLASLLHLTKDAHVDPITAIFNFLSTPAGQKLALGADDVFLGIIKDLITVFHHNNPLPPPKAS